MRRESPAKEHARQAFTAWPAARNSMSLLARAFARALLATLKGEQEERMPVRGGTHERCAYAHALQHVPGPVAAHSGQQMTGR